jgi:glutamyl-Q tRNA(Asp) synthetase
VLNAMPPVTRFAPSPTGYLHLGHARSALEVARSAQALGARMLLRIEDIDHTRCTPAFSQALIEDLAWLGLAYETPVRVQSAHRDEHLAVLEGLKARGLVYADDRARSGAKLEGPPAWRLSLERARETLGPARWADLGYQDLDTGWRPVDPSPHGDIVVGRRDIGLSYHLCVVWDDALQGVTHVVRGRDLEDQTAVHVLLQALLDVPTPAYRHHALILADDGAKKLSKRDGATALRALRAAGWSRDDVITAAFPPEPAPASPLP